MATTTEQQTNGSPGAAESIVTVIVPLVGIGSLVKIGLAGTEDPLNAVKSVDPPPTPSACLS